MLSKTVIAQEYSLAFNRSTVDGYAVRSTDTHGAVDSLPAYLRVVGEVRMGAAPPFSLHQGEAGVIHTGGMLPEGADAVVMLETTQFERSGMLEVYKPVSVNENVVVMGEDVKAGDSLFSAGTRIRPEEIGGLLSLGLTQISVYRKPNVHIFSSGDEVVAPTTNPQPGQVRDINTYALAALVARNGGEAITHPIVPDDPINLESVIRRVFNDADMIIITAGSSTSERDITAEVISRLGEPGVLVHGINVRPGKPTILAVCNGKPVIGLPGNPVSALFITRLFVSPLVERLSGQPQPGIQPSIQAILTINLASQAGRDDYIPVRLYKEKNNWKAAPISFKSNLIFSLSKADGLVHILADVTGYSADSVVEILLLQ